MLVTAASEKMTESSPENDEVSGIVEEDEIGRVEEQPERGETQVHPPRKADRRPGDAADQEHERCGDRKAPDDRHLRVDGAELELERQPSVLQISTVPA